jgi:antitoxin CptB
MEAAAKRLLWRCRRGMLELDIVLARFVAQHHATLSPQALKCLEDLLALPDNDLWELIVGKQPGRPEHQALLADLRHCATRGPV